MIAETVLEVDFDGPPIRVRVSGSKDMNSAEKRQVRNAVFQLLRMASEQVHLAYQLEQTLTKSGTHSYDLEAISEAGRITTAAKNGYHKRHELERDGVGVY